jgi:GAF domain-containing protein
LSLSVADLLPCLQGVIPSPIGTVAADGTPNVAYMSQVHFVDERHVALSCQFFNKTRRNLGVNPRATTIVVDPGTLAQYKLRLRFERSETEGPLFSAMEARLAAIAAQTGMSDCFKLRSADVFEVLSIEPMRGGLAEAPPPDEEPGETRDMTTAQLRGLQGLAALINRAGELSELLGDFLPGLDQRLGLEHSLLLLSCGGSKRLRIAAVHGLTDGALGSEIEVGEGLLGAVARSRQPLRISRLDRDLRYARAAARVAGSSAGPSHMPGLRGAQSLMAAPLVAHGELIGVLAAGSERQDAFDDRDESVFTIAANHVAAGIHGLLRARDLAPQPEVRRRFQLSCGDEALFVDHEYVTRGVAALIAWKLLSIHQREGRTLFTNRELRADPALKLPELKDNLESRLALLRKRLEQKCPDVRIVPAGRGRFELEVACGLELTEV